MGKYNNILFLFAKIRSFSTQPDTEFAFYPLISAYWLMPDIVQTAVRDPSIGRAANHLHGPDSGNGRAKIPEREIWDEKLRIKKQKTQNFSKQPYTGRHLPSTLVIASKLNTPLRIFLVLEDDSRMIQFIFFS